MGRLNRGIGLAAVAVAAGVGLGVPQVAEACGGTFCDGQNGQQGPMSMQVDQTGETIVFVQDGDFVEAHVQINYDPNSGAERFAWIVPLMQEPTISVGSQQLFLNLQNATAPSFGYVDMFDSCNFGGDDDWDDGWGGGGGGGDYCDGGGSDGGYGGGDGADEGGGFGDDAGEDGNTDGGGTEVVAQSTVGAFDYVLLQSTSADELMTWLADNDYYADPAATEILDEYLAEGAMFAAFKLTNGADVGEIHPITIRYEGGEPCVPIRLTRIAAQDDMDIRIFWIGQNRAYPTNYRHVDVNFLKLDWIGLGANYDEVVSMAVDAEGADGHAFVTEYFGPSDAVSTDGLLDPNIVPEAFEGLTPAEAVEMLQTQGLLLGCDFSGCEWGHPLAEGVVNSVLPVPEGVTPEQFYGCIDCYLEDLDKGAWDSVALSKQLSTRIVDPGQHALDLLQQSTSITRLYTQISPHEMTEDPFFHESAVDGEELVDYTADIQTRQYDCSGTAAMDVGSRTIQLGFASDWPDIAPEEMPFVETIEEHPDAHMAPIVLVDNTEVIDELVEKFNLGQPVAEPKNVGFRCEDYPGADASGPTGGCGCRTQGSGSTGWMLMALSLALGCVARRRRS